MAGISREVSEDESFMNIIGSISYDRRQLIGYGSGGIVFLGYYEGREVAVKQVQVDCHEGPTSEEKSLRQLDHRNVIKLLKVENYPAQFLRFYALSLAVGSLEDYCKGKYTGEIPANKEGLLNMATGMQYIHSKGIVHRDLNPSNILISKTLPVCLMISDFGISTPIDEDGTFPMNACGALSWMAPEILEILSDNLSARGTVKCDIWALGCLFFYFLTKGNHPYGNDRGSFVIQANVFYGSPFVLDDPSCDIPEFLRKLISKMIEKVPDQRPDLITVISLLNSLDM